MEFHKTKDGKKIKLADLELSHLENIIKWIERKAKEGLTRREGGGSTAEDMWCDETTYYGKEAKRLLKFSEYKSELERRQNNENKKCCRCDNIHNKEYCPKCGVPRNVTIEDLTPIESNCYTSNKSKASTEIIGYELANDGIHHFDLRKPIYK
jgi:hypothetical protein